MDRALVAIAALPRVRLPGQVDARTNASFLAHLVATAAGVPQTRARRRAEPNQATAAYRDALGQWPTESGRVLSRWL